VDLLQDFVDVDRIALLPPPLLLLPIPLANVLRRLPRLLRGLPTRLRRHFDALVKLELNPTRDKLWMRTGSRSFPFISQSRVSLGVRIPWAWVTSNRNGVTFPLRGVSLDSCGVGFAPIGVTRDFVGVTLSKTWVGFLYCWVALPERGVSLDPGWVAFAPNRVTRDLDGVTFSKTCSRPVFISSLGTWVEYFIVCIRIRIHLPILHNSDSHQI